MKPFYAVAYVVRARALVEAGKHKDAEATITEALSLYSLERLKSIPRAHIMLSLLFPWYMDIEASMAQLRLLLDECCPESDIVGREKVDMDPEAIADLFVDEFGLSRVYCEDPVAHAKESGATKGQLHDQVKTCTLCAEKYIRFSKHGLALPSLTRPEKRLFSAIRKGKGSEVPGAGDNNDNDGAQDDPYAMNR